MEELAREIECKVGARLVTEPGTPRNLDACARRYPLPSGGALWFSATSVPFTLDFPIGDYIRLQVQLHGAGATTARGLTTGVSHLQSCISPAEATLTYGAAFQQIFWRVPCAAITRKLVALTGIPCARDLAFEPVLSRSTSESHALLSILESMHTNIEHVGSGRRALVIAELEQAMIVSLLFSCKHNLSHLLAEPVSASAPWQVKLVEDYLDTHWDEPFDIEQIAAATQISVRSIYRAFQRNRGYSPKEFVRQRRLLRAQELLACGTYAGQTVTAVAFACGFSDSGHFSREFSRAFGETPSAFLRRRGDDPRARSR